MLAWVESSERLPEVAAERGNGGLTCVVADDHPVVLDAICALLEARGIEVSGRAQDGDGALAEIGERHPRVALLDLGMPRMDGAETARRARRVSPETAVIVYTGRSEAACLTEVLDAGARGFVAKDAPLDDLMRAIEMVAAGGVYVDPAVASVLVDAKGTGKLTPREREVLRLVADGLTNERVAERLFLSPQTVRGYVANAMGKLEARSRTQAVATALRERLIA